MTDRIEEPDPYDALETLGEMCGFIYHREGAAALRAFLAVKPEDVREELIAEGLEMALTFGPTTREDLIDAGDELHDAGMRKAARIVYKFAKTAPSEFDRLYPYSGVPDCNWVRKRDRLKREWEARQQERQERLKAQKAKN